MPSVRNYDGSPAPNRRLLFPRLVSRAGVLTCGALAAGGWLAACDSEDQLQAAKPGAGTAGEAGGDASEGGTSSDAPASGGDADAKTADAHDGGAYDAAADPTLVAWWRFEDDAGTFQARLTESRMPEQAYQDRGFEWDYRE